MGLPARLEGRPGDAGVHHRLAAAAERRAQRVQALFDYVNKAAALVTGSTKPLINTAPSSLVVFMLIGAVILSFLLALCTSVRSLPL